jgi:murein DD-endopeptidase MepM/ murein hydrolase activator NlpD
MMFFPAPILKGVTPSVSQGYGGGSGNHQGADIMYRRPRKGSFSLPTHSAHYTMPYGVPALAVTSGRVTRAGAIGTGGRVEIDHGNGLKTKYYHLRNLRVRAGDNVSAGQNIGEIYHNVSGYKLNHLHFEVIKNGRHIDPGPLLKLASMTTGPSPGLAIGFALAVAVAGYFLILK